MNKYKGEECGCEACIGERHEKWVSYELAKAKGFIKNWTTSECAMYLGKRWDGNLMLVNIKR